MSSPTLQMVVVAGMMSSSKLYPISLRLASTPFSVNSAIQEPSTMHRS